MLETTKQSIGILLNVTTYDRLPDMFTCYLIWYFSTIRFDPNASFKQSLFMKSTQYGVLCSLNIALPKYQISLNSCTKFEYLKWTFDQNVLHKKVLFFFCKFSHNYTHTHTLSPIQLQEYKTTVSHWPFSKQ